MAAIIITTFKRRSALMALQSVDKLLQTSQCGSVAVVRSLSQARRKFPRLEALLRWLLTSLMIMH
jgi:hypothetical protein